MPVSTKSLGPALMAGLRGEPVMGTSFSKQGRAFPPLGMPLPSRVWPIRTCPSRTLTTSFSNHTVQSPGLSPNVPSKTWIAHRSPSICSTCPVRFPLLVSMVTSSPRAAFLPFETKSKGPVTPLMDLVPSL